MSEQRYRREKVNETSPKRNRGNHHRYRMTAPRVRALTLLLAFGIAWMDGWGWPWPEKADDRAQDHPHRTCVKRGRTTFGDACIAGISGADRAQH